MRRLSIVLLLPALAILAACTSSEDLALLHREITDVQRSVASLQTEVIDKSDLRAMEQSMSDLTNKNMRSNADLAQKVGDLQE
jgi:phage host-nuclease inhibitor protein Gam